jgi:hypothetical protein
MANISPGVYTKIIDLSEYVQNVPSTIAFMPIVSEYGEDNKLIATNGRDFYVDFGEPNINYGGSTAKQFSQGKYVASSFLKESDQLYVIRVVSDNATYSNLILKVETAGESGLGTDGTSDVTVTWDLSTSTTNALDTLVNINSNPENGLVIYGVGRGEWYNNFEISISQHANPEKAGVYILDIYQKQTDPDPDTGLDQFEIIETYEVSFDYRDVDASGDSMYIEDVINRFSRYLRCKANKDVLLVADSTDSADFSQPFISGAIRLDGGTSGDLIASDGSIDETEGNSLLIKAYTGTLVRADGEYLTEVLDLDNIYFSIVFDGGYNTDVKTNGIWTLVQTRKDCIAVIDNGDNYTVNQSIAARENDHTFNTRYMAMYEPYSKIFDAWTGRDIWITPVYHMANIIPYTENVSELWSAPAGFNRATIATIKELRFSPLQGERDRLYLKQINPIVKFNVGYTVWGQLTTQKRPTALQDFNIVRLVLYIKRALEQYCKFYIFEQNDTTTWSAVSNEVNAFLKVIQDKRGLYGYSVTADASEYEIKAKQFRLDVSLNPTRVVEQISLNLYIK